MNMQNKVIVVSGAGGGLGRQLVLELVSRGAAVAAVDINLAALEETRQQANARGGTVSLHPIDITNKAQVRLLPDQVLAVHGRVDGLINNAGIIQDFITVIDLPEAAVERLMNINFYGMLNMTRALVPALAARDEAVVANVSSMGGFLPVPGQAIYGASKAAVKIATEGLRIELSQTKISVSLILPGGIETDIKTNSGLAQSSMTDEAKKTAGIKLTSPQQAARVILKGLEAKRAKILVGADSKVMDLLYRLVPGQAAKLMSKVMAANHGGLFNRPADLRQANGEEKCR